MPWWQICCGGTWIRAKPGFRGLFRFNLTDSPWGWQIVVVARKN